MAFCPRCDADNPDEASTCQSCGAPMRSGTMVMASANLLPRPQVSFRVVRADGGPEAMVSHEAGRPHVRPQGDLPLPDDPFVAPEQARFFFSGARLAVEDVGGGNGVFTRLRNERELPTGGELRLGRQRLVLEPDPRGRAGRRRRRGSGARRTRATGCGWCSCSRAACAAAPSAQEGDNRWAASRATSPSPGRLRLRPPRRAAGRGKIG